MIIKERIETGVLQLVSEAIAWHYRVVPFASEDNLINVYSNLAGFDSEKIDELSILLDREIIITDCDENTLNRLLITNYGNRSEGRNKEDLSSNTDFLQKLIDGANTLNSSDIHIEPYENNSRVRYRLDGKLIEKYLIPKEDYPGLLNKIKIRANLDIAEKRRPQDGRIKINQNNTEVDIRVSIVPTIYGEKAVLRLLKKDKTNIDLESLGFNEQQIKSYTESIRKDNGIVLISGPTGSGKTTTLYATLKLLNSESTNISTIEDPVEYTLEGINQVQLNDKIGLSFAAALRTFLRQDPDIIMLGEIRDNETAEMAVRAALTGHMVLSTIHTNSAWGTISRLIDMGVPSYLLASVLNASIAQRLIRKLCESCKVKHDVNELKLEKEFLDSRKIKCDFLYTSTGCNHCHYTGYDGRMAIYEIIPVDSTISRYIKENKYSIDEVLVERGIQTLYNQAIEKMTSGITSFEEVYPLLLNN